MLSGDFRLWTDLKTSQQRRDDYTLLPGVTNIPYRKIEMELFEVFFSLYVSAPDSFINQIELLAVALFYRH